MLYIVLLVDGNMGKQRSTYVRLS